MNYYIQIVAEIEALYPNIEFKKLNNDSVSSYQTLVEVSEEIFETLEKDMPYCNCGIKSSLKDNDLDYAHLRFIDVQLPYIGLVIFKPTLESSYVITKL